MSRQAKGSVAFLSVPDRLADRLAALAPGYPDVSLCIALSGGVDSVCLLHAAREVAARHPTMALRAIHVDHGLQRQSARWSARCQELCQRLGVPLEVANLGLAVVKGASVEAEARRKRYAALAARLQAGECLLTAHHADDQLETVLLQLFRGAGTAGLAAMPQSCPLGAGLHLRPLLDLGRDELAAYAAAVGLAWIEDPMNAASRFDRAYLRHEVLPAIRRRWPSVARTVGRSARHLAEAQQLLESLARADGERLVDDRGRLGIVGLAALPRERQANVLRWWIVGQGIGVPSAARLGSILQDVVAARDGAQPVVTWPAGEVRRYRGRLYAMQPLGPPPPPGWEREISPGEALELPSGLGRFSLELETGASRGSGGAAAPLRVFFMGGRPTPAAGDRPSSGALREAMRLTRVCPWARRHVPILRENGRILAVADTWVTAAAPVERGGGRMRLSWVGGPVFR